MNYIIWEHAFCILGKLLKKQDLPKEEENFQKIYVKAPSFLSIHMGVKAEVLPPDTDCHHFVLEVLRVPFLVFTGGKMGRLGNNMGHL